MTQTVTASLAYSVTDSFGEAAVLEAIASAVDTSPEAYAYVDSIGDYPEVAKLLAAGLVFTSTSARGAPVLGVTDEGWSALAELGYQPPWDRADLSPEDFTSPGSYGYGVSL